MNNEKQGFTECYVAFLDLMGVRNLVKACEKDDRLYGNVITALLETKNISSFHRQTQDLETGLTTRWMLQVQAFSDCVVLFIPTESQMLSWLLASIRRLHDRLLRLGIPLRGGVTIGGMHWLSHGYDDNPEHNEINEAVVAFGPGLVSGYDLENGVAVYPRILISDGLFDDICEKKANGFPFGKDNLRNYCRQDTDGLRHLDVLHPDANRQDAEPTVKGVDEKGAFVTYSYDDTPYDEWLSEVRGFIEKNLNAVKGEKLQSKYRWLARYYNDTVQKSKVGKPIRIFEDLVPSNAIKLEVKAKDK
ncbi:MAG: hypothetical protein NXI22_19080 [bacterium]|nr:hypothetical protein [bacterium]